MNTFREFVDVKGRKAKMHLDIVKKILENSGMKVRDYLSNRDPYLFVENPHSNTSFEGVRVYSIGEKLAYRVQREKETHPYGKAYLIDFDEMYQDMLEDNTDPKKIGKELEKWIVNEIKDFFKHSKKIEDEGDDADGLGIIYVKNSYGDYASSVSSPNQS